MKKEISLGSCGKDSNIDAYCDSMVFDKPGRMTRFIVIDSRNNKYKSTSLGFSSTKWTKDIQKAQLFKNKGSAKKGMYSYNINPKRGYLGEKIILPDWVVIKEITFSLGDL